MRDWVPTLPWELKIKTLANRTRIRPISFVFTGLWQQRVRGRVTSWGEHQRKYPSWHNQSSRQDVNSLPNNKGKRIAYLMSVFWYWAHLNESCSLLLLTFNISSNIILMLILKKNKRKIPPSVIWIGMNLIVKTLYSHFPFFPCIIIKVKNTLKLFQRIFCKLIEKLHYTENFLRSFWTWAWWCIPLIPHSGSRVRQISVQD